MLGRKRFLNGASGLCDLLEISFLFFSSVFLLEDWVFDCSSFPSSSRYYNYLISYAHFEFQEGTLETEALSSTLTNQLHFVFEEVGNLEIHNGTSTFPPCLW